MSGVGRLARSEVYLLVNLVFLFVFFVCFFFQVTCYLILQWIALILRLLLRWRGPLHIQPLNDTKDQMFVTFLRRPKYTFR